MKEYYWQILALFCALFVPSEQFLGNNIFSSGDTRLFKTFCVKTEEELEAIGKTTWYNQNIFTCFWFLYNHLSKRDQVHSVSWIEMGPDLTPSEHTFDLQ